MASGLWAWSSVSARQPAARDLAAVLDRSPGFSGVVLLAEQDQIYFRAARGFSDHSRRQSLGPGASFNLASLSKPFTALAIAQLAEAGQLDYADPIQKYLDLPYAGITIDQLLGHRSGLPEYMALAAQHWDTRRTLYNRDVLALYRQHRPALNFAPGSRFEYSNAGYVLLAAIVEAASGQSFADYLKAHVFAPAGMRSSFVYVPGASQPVVKGMRQLGPLALPDDLGWLDGVVGDGGIYSSAPDLFRWHQALLAGKLLSPAGLARLYAPGKLSDGQATDYGYGWALDPKSQVRWHNGAWAGFRSLLVHNPENGILAIILSNNGYQESHQLLQRLLAAPDAP